MFKKILVGVIALSLLFASAASATVTISGAKHDVWGSKRVTYGYITITGAPTSSGYAVTARKLGLSTIDKVLLYPDATYPDVDWTYNGSGSNGSASTSGYLVPMLQSLIDKRQVVPLATSDSIRVRIMKPQSFTADAETSLVLVTPISGNIARFHSPLSPMDTGAHATSAIGENIFTATDGITMGVMADTGLAGGGPIGRNTNTTLGWYRGDTLYFLPAYSDITAKLAYSGKNTLGAAVAATNATLYVPFGLGNYIKVTKMTGAQLYAANAVAVYYASKGALASKFIVSKAAGVPSAADPIVVYRTPTTSSGFTTVLYFVAIGN